MAKLPQIVHTALDEVRMQMMGTQVLFGFQLQGAFQESFKDLPGAVRGVDAAALSLLVVTFGLLIAGPSQHRLVERGVATKRILAVAGRFAEVALLTFALALGADIFIVCEHYSGSAAAVATGAAAVVLALLFWFGAGRLLGRTHPEERLPEAETPLHEKIEQMLTEARVILPGAQALLGFQFIVTMAQPFESLSPLERGIHFAALAAVALAVMLLLTPAAVHRLAFAGRDVERFHDIGSALVTAALVPLAFGIAADFQVAIVKMVGDQTLAATGAALAALLLATLWFGVPLYLREKGRP